MAFRVRLPKIPRIPIPKRVKAVAKAAPAGLLAAAKAHARRLVEQAREVAEETVVGAEMARIAKERGMPATSLPPFYGYRERVRREAEKRLHPVEAWLTEDRSRKLQSMARAIARREGYKVEDEELEYAAPTEAEAREKMLEFPGVREQVTYRLAREKAKALGIDPDRVKHRGEMTVEEEAEAVVGEVLAKRASEQFLQKLREKAKELGKDVPEVMLRRLAEYGVPSGDPEQGAMERLKTILSPEERARYETTQEGLVAQFEAWNVRWARYMEMLEAGQKSEIPALTQQWRLLADEGQRIISKLDKSRLTPEGLDAIVEKSSAIQKNEPAVYFEVGKLADEKYGQYLQGEENARAIREAASGDPKAAARVGIATQWHGMLKRYIDLSGITGHAPGYRDREEAAKAWQTLAELLDSYQNLYGKDVETLAMLEEMRKLLEQWNWQKIPKAILPETRSSEFFSGMEDWQSEFRNLEREKRVLETLLKDGRFKLSAEIEGLIAQLAAKAQALEMSLTRMRKLFPEYVGMVTSAAESLQPFTDAWLRREWDGYFPSQEQEKAHIAAEETRKRTEQKVATETEEARIARLRAEGEESARALAESKVRFGFDQTMRAWAMAMDEVDHAIRAGLVSKGIYRRLWRAAKAQLERARRKWPEYAGSMTWQWEQLGNLDPASDAGKALVEGMRLSDKQAEAALGRKFPNVLRLYYQAMGEGEEKPAKRGSRR